MELCAAAWTICFTIPLNDAGYNKMEHRKTSRIVWLVGIALLSKPVIIAKVGIPARISFERDRNLKTLV